MTPELTVVPANEASWDDLQAVFGTRGDPSRCRCQRYKMERGESWSSVGREELAFRLRTQTDCGRPDSDTTSGLVAYRDGEPVGWCAVEPRTAYPRLLLKTRVPWDVPLLVELQVGSRSMFEASGFTEVSHPTSRRAVMRIDF